MSTATSAGPAIEASVNDPSSPEAVFVPFNDKDGKTKVKTDRRSKSMAKIVESLRSGGMDEVRNVIHGILKESCSDVSDELRRRRILAECKGNKEEFKKWLEAKKAASKGGKKEEDAKKPSAKDKFKALMLNKKKKVSESSGEKCASCGADCGAGIEVNGRKYCKGCYDEAKKKRISEGVKKLESALNAKNRINESKGWVNVYSDMVKAAEADHTALGAKMRTVINKDVFNGVMSDGKGNGYVEHGSSNIPNYAYDYALKFAKEWRRNSVNEDSNFSKEEEILRKAYMRHHLAECGNPVNEDRNYDETDSIDDIWVASHISVSGDEEAEKVKDAAMKHGLSSVYYGKGVVTVGLSLLKSVLSYDEISSKISSSMVAVCNDAGIDDGFGDAEQYVCAIPVTAEEKNYDVVYGIKFRTDMDEATAAKAAQIASEHGMTFHSTVDGYYAYGVSFIDNKDKKPEEMEELVNRASAAFVANIEDLGVDVNGIRSDVVASIIER